ncbi:hypothetical protein [Lactobacillus intestinalis]|uniref:hypothetical protein n=1 Tax=Lactobacillus intestinalis TaxID=151781 RepID=UPI0026F36F03|nr:hypothetical protein [Lactobacillus intestinalis]
MKTPKVECFIKNLNKKGYMVLNGDGTCFIFIDSKLPKSERTGVKKDFESLLEPPRKVPHTLAY